MPIKPDNPDHGEPGNSKKDSVLAALLHKAEPPKSPAHLDDAILRYARENAPARKSSGMLGDWSWLHRNWVPAVATFSVAMIGISVSLQLFTDPELARVPTGIAVQDFAQDNALSTNTEQLQRERQEQQEQQAAAPTAPAAPAPLQELRERLEFAVNDVARASADAVVAEEVAAEVAAVAAVEATVEEQLNVASLAADNSQARRSSAAGQAVTSVPVLPNLATGVTDDVSLQDTVIIALRRALGMREQTAVQRRGRFPDEIRPYIETYRDLRDATILANVQTRYEVAKADLLDARLPQTIAELVSILETL